MAQNRIPKLRRQKKPNGGDLAFVVLGGQRYYLGRFDNAGVQEAYRRKVGEWLVGGECTSTTTDAPYAITIVELVAAFWKYAEVYYANPGGDTTGETTCFKYAFKPLKALYAETPATDFGPIALKAVRQVMVDNGWSRPYTNAQVFRIKRMFKWAVAEELIPASVFHRLGAVESMRLGRTDAPEPHRVMPVDDDVVDATVECLTPTVAAMVTVQRWTGMRPGEVCRMRLADLDMSGETWIYSPKHHKTKYLGRERKVYLGPKAQQALTPYLRIGLKGYLFTPKQSEIERRAMQHAERKTPMSCGNVPGSNCRRNPVWKAGDRYTPQTYGKAVTYACRKAFPATEGLNDEAAKQWHRDHHWSPNQLRHTFATMIRRERGLEDSQVLLGHAQADTTQIYAERDEARALEAIRKIG